MWSVGVAMMDKAQVDPPTLTRRPPHTPPPPMKKERKTRERNALCGVGLAMLDKARAHAEVSDLADLREYQACKGCGE